MMESAIGLEALLVSILANGGASIAGQLDVHLERVPPLGGFVVTSPGQIHRAGDHFEAAGLRFEVMDMDGHRVDKVLVSTPRVAPTVDSERRG